MFKNSFPVLIAAVIFLLFGANSAFGQCGDDGTKPCPKATPKKKTILKKATVKTTPKPTITKPKTTNKPQTTISKPQPETVNRAPQIEMVKISAGSFMMGSNNGDNDEKPVHRVNLTSDFYMSKFELTQAQWQFVMGKNPSKYLNCGGNCPVEQVNWYMVQEFIQKLNNLQDEYQYRLPTEAEWEYACRAGTTSDYAGDLDLMAWYGTNCDDKSHPVGQKSPNAWGLYDMHGNVWEWVQDLHGAYPSATATNPTGAANDISRLFRGGACNTDAQGQRSANRASNLSSTIDEKLGFRLARY